VRACRGTQTGDTAVVTGPQCRRVIGIATRVHTGTSHPRHAFNRTTASKREGSDASRRRKRRRLRRLSHSARLKPCSSGRRRCSRLREVRPPAAAGPAASRHGTPSAGSADPTRSVTATHARRTVVLVVLSRVCTLGNQYGLTRRSPQAVLAAPGRARGAALRSGPCPCRSNGPSSRDCRFRSFSRRSSRRRRKTSCAAAEAARGRRPRGTC
jgi:hypothetical protein